MAYYHNGADWSQAGFSPANPLSNTATTTTSTTLGPGGYNFQVCCNKNNTNYGCSDQVGVDISTCPLGCASNLTMVCTSPYRANFSWSAISGADKYVARINNTSNGWHWDEATGLGCEDDPSRGCLGDRAVYTTAPQTGITDVIITPGVAYGWSIQGVKPGETSPYTGCQKEGAGFTCPTPSPTSCPVPPAVTQSGPPACTSQAGSFTITDKGTGCYPHDARIDVCSAVSASGVCTYAGGSNGAWVSDAFPAANTNFTQSIRSSNALESGHYWWRGWSRNGDYYQAESPGNDYGEFEVDRLAPAAAPSLTASVSDCTNEPAAALTWPAVSDRGCLGDISYWLQVSSTSPAKDAAGGIAANVQNGWISGTNYTLPAPKCGQTYYAQIKAADTEGGKHPNQTDWSGIVTFTVTCRPTCTIDPNPVSNITSFGTATLTNTGGYADGATGNFSYGWFVDDACDARRFDPAILNLAELDEVSRPSGSPDPRRAGGGGQETLPNGQIENGWV